MTTRQRRTAFGTGIVEAIGRVTLIGLFTGVETVALGVWLAIVGDAQPLSQTMAIGLGVLVGGLVVEHILTDLAVNGGDLSFPVGPVILVSLSETVLWALWFGVADQFDGLAGLLLAGVLFAAFLVPQHTIEDNVLRGRELFETLLDPGTVPFSLVEAAGATVWLLFLTRSESVAPLLAAIEFPTADPASIGLGVLAVALFVEHVIGVEYSRP